MADTAHVVGTVGGAIIGGAAVAVLAPVVLPAIGLGAVLTAAGATVPWVGAAVGGWFGHKASEPK